MPLPMHQSDWSFPHWNWINCYHSDLIDMTVDWAVLWHFIHANTVCAQHHEMQSNNNRCVCDAQSYFHPVCWLASVVPVCAIVLWPTRQLMHVAPARTNLKIEFHLKTNHISREFLTIPKRKLVSTIWMVTDHRRLHTISTVNEGPLSNFVVSFLLSAFGARGRLSLVTRCNQCIFNANDSFVFRPIKPLIWRDSNLKSHQIQSH